MSTKEEQDKQTTVEKKKHYRKPKTKQHKPHH